MFSLFLDGLTLNTQVADYDAFSYSVESFRDWLAGLKADLLLTEEGVTDKTAAEAKLRVISDLLDHRDEGHALLAGCQLNIDNICDDSGCLISKEMLKQELDVQQQSWNAFLAECQQRQDQLTSLCSRWNVFEDTAHSLATWLRQAEGCVQDQSLKATVAAKQAHLEKLAAAQVLIAFSFKNNIFTELQFDLVVFFYKF